MTDEPCGADSHLEPYLQRLVQGDRLALSRLISGVENGTFDAEFLAQTTRVAKVNPITVGVTGPPGAGKSTLIAALIDRYLDANHRVAALLVDPSSRATGGAILADRVRIPPRLRDDQLFVRSRATRGNLGGGARMTKEIVELIGVWGAEIVLIETVGAGQTDVAIADIVDCTVVVCPPGLGDEMQAMKAGLMEIADIFVVNKADREGSDSTVAALSDAGMGGRSHQSRSVVRTIATDGSGVPELVEQIEGITNRRRDRASNGMERTMELLISSALGRTRRVVFGESPEVTDLLAGVLANRIDIRDATRRVLQLATEQ